MTLTDAVRLRIFLALAALVPITLFFSPLSSFDLWWHLDSGRWMLEHGNILLEEVRSYTASGKDWVNHAWLFQLAMAGVERLAGLWGVWGAKAALWAALFFVLADSSVRRSDQIPGYLVVVLLITPTIAHALVLRPHLLEYLFLLILIRLFHSRLTPRQLTTYAVLVIVWANIHASAPVAAAAIGTHILFTRDATPTLSRWPARLAATGLIGLCIFVTPHGLSILDLLTEHGTSTLLSTYNFEWHRPDALPPVLFILLAMSLYGIARHVTRLKPGEILLMLFFAYLALVKYRFAYEVLLLLVRPATQTCAHLLLQTRDLGRWAPTLFACLFATAWETLAPGHLGQFAHLGHIAELMDTRLPYVAARFPVATSRMLNGLSDALGRPLRVFNYYGFGGYIEWATNGKALVQIDGRTPTIFDEQQLLENAIGMANRGAFERLADTGSVDAVLTDRVIPLPFPLEDKRWALVGYDEASLLFLHRDRLDSTGVTALTYDPNSYHQNTASLSDLDATRKLLALAPENVRAWNQLGALLLKTPQGSTRSIAEILNAFSTARSLDPRDTYSTLQLSNLLLETRSATPEQIARLTLSLPHDASSASTTLHELQQAEILLHVGLAEAALEVLHPTRDARTRSLDKLPLTWILRARARLSLGQQDAAWLPFYMAHLSVDPGNPGQVDAIRAIGIALGVYEEAPSDASR